jgi:hypothetical protein
MSGEIGQSIRDFFRKRHNVFVGFAFCYFLALLIQFTGQGLFIVIAGLLAGFLMKSSFRGILVCFFAGLLSWLTLFAIMAFNYTNAFINAWDLVGQMFPAPQLLSCLIAGVITGVGGQLGALFAGIAYPQVDDRDLLEVDRVPTDELPKRKRVKRKQPKRKKRKKRY